MDKGYASARRVTLVTRDSSGKTTSEIRYQRARRDKRGTVGVRSVDDFVRRLTRADMVMDQSYLSRHDRSNKDRSDGWLLDLETNILNAARKGLRELERDDNDELDKDENDEFDTDDDDQDLEVDLDRVE
jgi:hypothetical protein